MLQLPLLKNQEPGSSGAREYEKFRPPLGQKGGVKTTPYSRGTRYEPATGSGNGTRSGSGNGSTQYMHNSYIQTTTSIFEMTFEYVCPVCHEAYTEELERCLKCGELVVIRWIRCSVCKTANEGYEEYCLLCGEPLVTGQAIASIASRNCRTCRFCRSNGCPLPCLAYAALCEPAHVWHWFTAARRCSFRTSHAAII